MIHRIHAPPFLALIALAIFFFLALALAPGGADVAAGQVAEGTVTPSPTLTPTATLTPVPTATPIPTATITIVKDAHCAELYDNGVYNPFGYGFDSAYGPYDYFGLNDYAFGDGRYGLGYCGLFGFDAHQLGTFTLDGNLDRKTFTVVANQRYVFTEVLRSPWVLRSINCDRGEDRRQTDTAGRSVSITPLPGGDYVCTFVNVLRIPTPTPTATAVPPTSTPQPPAATAVPATAIPATPVVVNVNITNPIVQVPAAAPAAPAPVAPAAPAAAVIRPPNTGSAGLLPKADLVRNEWGDGDDGGGCCYSPPQDFGPIPASNEDCW